MENMDKITELLKKIGELLLVISGALGVLGQFFKKLMPAIKFLTFLATQIIPNGIILWGFLYIAASNADRLTEPNVFLSIVGQELALIFIFNSIWGIWLYPKLRNLLLVNKKEPEVKKEPKKEPETVNHKKRSKSKK
jgi:hypothetical protein